MEADAARHREGRDGVKDEEEWSTWWWMML